MDWELILLAAITVIGWGLLIIGKINADTNDTTVHRNDPNWYDRYYGKEDKKWGR
jgi:hypothetical protein